MRANRSAIQHEVPDWALLLESSEFRNAHTIASYISYGDEPSTQTLNFELLKRDKNLLLPRLLSDRNLEWVPWDGRDDSLSQPIGSGYREPIGNTYDGEIDLLIIPALAVDMNGNRLGQGGGSYDRALETLQSWKVALIYDDEILDTDIPVELHDQRVNAAVTPVRLVRFSEKG